MLDLLGVVIQRGGIDQLDVVKGQGIIADDLLIGNEKLLTAHEILLTDSQKQSLREVEDFEKLLGVCINS